LFSPRTLLAAPLFLAFFFTGCGPNVALVENVPPPAFGPRHIGMPPLPPRTVAPPVQAGAWVPPVPERKWRYILIHHSASPTGSAAMFDRAHRERGWNELGYDFVIGNGSLTGDGQVEIGPRWTKQVTGAHAGVRDHPEFNEFGVGICLVGNFDLGRPSAAQMQSLVSLVRWLMHRYDIPKTRVLGHGMLKPTDCPGKEFPWTDFYRRLN
jgi:hypothetical protein